MDKSPKQVTKKRRKKLHETYIERLKVGIPKENRLSTGRSTSSTSSSIDNSTTIYSNTYIYGVGIVAVLTIGVCVFFTYKK